MIFLKWLALTLVGFALDLLGLIMVPIGLLFCDAASTHMPASFWPWDNDNDGINGDAGWASAEHANGQQNTFWWRFLWLAIRNPGNNFGYLLGRVPSGQFQALGNPLTSNQGMPGWLLVTCDNCWCAYIVLPWTTRICLRIALGWKIWDLARTNAQIVCVINPFATFTPE